jgi:hypothetical protein
MNSEKDKSETNKHEQPKRMLRNFFLFWKKTTTPAARETANPKKDRTVKRPIFVSSDFSYHRCALESKTSSGLIFPDPAALPEERVHLGRRLFDFRPRVGLI